MISKEDMSILIALSLAYTLIAVAMVAAFYLGPHAG